MNLAAFIAMLLMCFAVILFCICNLRRLRRQAKMDRIRFVEGLDRQFPICPNCGTVPEIEWTWANVFSECPECAMEFTRNQWFGKPQADDYPGGPLDRNRFR